MLSQQTLCYYLKRLFLLLAVGVGANWFADIITGRDWQGDPANTVFQMCYVVMLIVMALLTSHLRKRLRGYEQNRMPTPVDWTSIAAVIFWGVLTSIGFVHFLFLKPLPLEELVGSISPNHHW